MVGDKTGPSSPLLGPSAGLETTALERLIVDCRDHSARGQRHEQGPCYELMIRAIARQDGQAWAAIERQYRKLIFRWLLARGAREAELEDLAQETLTRFWQTLATQETPQHLGTHPPLSMSGQAPRFDRLSALLRYLQMCAISVHLDRIRQTQRFTRLKERCGLELNPDTNATAALEVLCQAEKFQQVRQWIAEAVTDPDEQWVLELSLQEGLSPAEVARRFPERFPDAAAVYRLKERLLKRARRALAGMEEAEE